MCAPDTLIQLKKKRDRPRFDIVCVMLQPEIYLPFLYIQMFVESVFAVYTYYRHCN